MSEVNYFIKPGYKARQQPPLYFDDVLDQEQGVIHQPEVYPFAAFLARRFECTHIVDVGCGQARKLAELHPEFKLVGIDFGGNINYCQQNYDYGQWIEWNFDQPEKLVLAPDILRRSLIVCSDVIEHLAHPEHLADQFHAWMEYAPVALMTTPDRDRMRGDDDMGPPGNVHHVREWSMTELGAFLDSRQLRVEFLGLTVSNDLMRPKHTTLAILANNHRPPIEPAPPEFRVAAIITTYNEADIILPVIDYLNTQGVEAHVIDNWSTDGTYQKVCERIDHGVTHVERFPAEGEKGEHQYNWQELLRRKEELSQTLHVNWMIHYDADELRESPWPDVTLRDALYHVDQCGFNCIDHTCLDFFPVDESFRPDANPGEKLKYYGFGRYPGQFTHINAWKNMGQSVSLWKSGGHLTEFEGQRVYPYKFLLRHYPLRTRQQATQKIRERQKSSNWFEQKVLGWHIMYDHFDADDQQFYDDLCKETRHKRAVFDDETFYIEFLVERLSGVGIERLQRRTWKARVPKVALPFFRLGRRLLYRFANR